MIARWSLRALDELDAITLFIAQDDSEAALAWAAKLVAVADRAALSPRAGRVVPELKDPSTREVVSRRYRLIYRVEKDHILILTVFEGSRLLRF